MTDSAPKIGERTFRVGDLGWVTQVTGQTQSGSGSDAGAPLLYLAFASLGSPGVWAHEAIAVARSLDDLSDDELEALLARARPYRTGSSGIPSESTGVPSAADRDPRAQ